MPAAKKAVVKKVVAKKPREEFYFTSAQGDLQGPYASIEVLLEAAVDNGDVSHGDGLEIFTKIKTVEVSMMPTYKEV